MTASIPKDISVFHKGEQAMQSRVGKRADMEKLGRAVIRPYMPDQHREFFEQIPFLVLGSVDQDGWPWASILPGEPGFIRAPTDRRLTVTALPHADDPLGAALKAGAPIGVLGIELPTRRRNRVNATVGRVTEGGFSLDVVQSFGNCPKYIQTHDIRFIRDPNARQPMRIERLKQLDTAAQEAIASANSFYVASHARTPAQAFANGVDVSHRGGRSGFVKVEGNSLLIPDFAGNNFFNTLGNFLLNPRAGLLFPDYQTGDLLMLTGTVEVLEENHPDIAAFHGAGRAWRFEPDYGLRLIDALPFRGDLVDYSPNSLIADSWQNAEARVNAGNERSAWRSLRVAAIQNESETIRSFTFAPTDDLPLPSFEPGQFLTIRVQPDGQQPLTRTYTVSSAPDDEGYRISVKREPGGVVSNHVHDRLAVGDRVEVKAPKGRFVFDARAARPAVLFAGGVGITPMMSMVRNVLNDPQNQRPLTVFYAAQTTGQRAFHAELRRAEEVSGGRIRYLSVIGRPEEGDRTGVDFHAEGRISPDLIRETLALDDYEFFLCGPPGFMQAVYDMLLGLGVRDERVFAEGFGPAALKRRLDVGTKAFVPEPEAQSATVTFAASRKAVEWKAGGATLLELAEAQGLTPPFSCRGGSCGSCLTRRIAGKVAYRTPPVADHSDDDILLCCAVPAEGTGELKLDL